MQENLYAILKIKIEQWCFFFRVYAFLKIKIEQWCFFFRVYLSS